MAETAGATVTNNLLTEHNPERKSSGHHKHGGKSSSSHQRQSSSDSEKKSSHKHHKSSGSGDPSHPTVDRKVSSISLGGHLHKQKSSELSLPDRKVSSVSVTSAVGQSQGHPVLERKASSFSVPSKDKAQEKKVSVCVPSGSTGGHQGLSATLDNVLLREARSASLVPSNGIAGGSPTHIHNPHVPRKFIHTWRQACDKTKERTKDLIKRWRTLPEDSPLSTPSDGEPRTGSWSQQDSWAWAGGEEGSGSGGDNQPHSGGAAMTEKSGGCNSGPVATSEEAWWRCRGFPGQPPPPVLPLAPEQRTKLAQLFNTLLDTDSDGLVSSDDFHALAERLREFAGWKEHGSHACMLREVIGGLLEAFLRSLHSPPQEYDEDEEGAPLSPVPHTESPNLGLFLGLDDWLGEWSTLLRGARALSDLPLWLQYFPKILFAAINRSGSGVISSEELRYFYTSFLGFDSRKVDEVMSPAYDAMTANGDHQLNCPTYLLVFANFLLGRHPNGPGQFVFGPFGETGRLLDDCVTFPVDYSAMNSLPEDLEEYSPGRKSNRRSVIV